MDNDCIRQASLWDYPDGYLTSLTQDQYLALRLLIIREWYLRGIGDGVLP